MGLSTMNSNGSDEPLTDVSTRPNDDSMGDGKCGVYSMTLGGRSSGGGEVAVSRTTTTKSVKPLEA